jgi:RNA polymerase sigma factor (sigma-70 family)
VIDRQAGEKLHVPERPQGPGERDRLAAVSLARSHSEPECFSVVYELYVREIHGYVARRLGADAADDIAAATFETAFMRRLAYDADLGSVRSWLYGIATHLVSRRHRDEERRYRALARVGAEPAAAGHEDAVTSKVAAAAELRSLAGALARLPESDRDVLMLVALGGLSLTEVSVALRIPYGTAGSRLSRARQAIRRHAASARTSAQCAEDQ